MNRAAATAGLLVLALVAADGCAKIVGIGTLPYPPDATMADDAGDDSETDDGGDAAPESACAAVTVSPPIPDGGGAACPSGSDSGACTPIDRTGFHWNWRPPVGMHLDKCTSEQIASFLKLCFAPNATSATCDPWRLAPSNAACLGCLLTTDSDNQLGATVAPVGYGGYVNVAGCLALVEPCNQPCALALQSQFECGYTACAACSFAERPSCIDGAWTCAACRDYELATACLVTIESDPDHHAAVSACGLGQTSDKQYTAVATLMCGP